MEEPSYFFRLSKYHAPYPHPYPTPYPDPYPDPDPYPTPSPTPTLTLALIYPYPSPDQLRRKLVLKEGDEEEGGDFVFTCEPRFTRQQTVECTFEP